MQIHELPDGVIGETEYSPVDNGSTNRKVTLADIGAYVLNTLTMSLGGATRTVKAAIDAIQTKVGTATLNTTAQDLSGATNEIDAKIGSATMGTTATTITGAIAEHEDDISTLNSKTTVQNLSSQISATSAITLQSDKFLLRFGNLCVLQMRFSLNAATTANTKIAQLPVYPYNNNGNGHISLAFKIWGLNTDSITTYIKPDGSVNISANATTGNDYVIQTTFMCAN